MSFRGDSTDQSGSSIAVSSPILSSLKVLYSAHFFIGCFFALVLIIVPNGLTNEKVTCSSERTMIGFRSYGCAILGLLIILWRFRSIDRIRYHKILALALFVFHGTSFIVLLVLMFIVDTFDPIQRWFSWTLVGLSIHVVCLAVILWRPGVRWFFKVNWRYHMSFNVLKEDDAKNVKSVDLLYKAIEECFQNQTVGDDRTEALEFLWDQLDTTQNNVLNFHDAIRFLKTFALFHKNTTLKAIKHTKSYLEQIQNQQVLLDIENFETTSTNKIDDFISRVDAGDQNDQGIVATFMSRLDLEEEGQVGKDVFFLRIYEVSFSNKNFFYSF